MTKLGEWLRQKRTAKRMLQSEVAKRAGVSTSYISTIERGQKHSTTGASLKPEREKVLAIAKAVGGDPDEALLAAGYAPASYQPPTTAVEIIEAIGKLLPEGSLPTDGLLAHGGITEENAQMILEQFQLVLALRLPKQERAKLVARIEPLPQQRPRDSEYTKDEVHDMYFAGEADADTRQEAKPPRRRKRA